MADVAQLAADLQRALQSRVYIRRLDWLTVGRSIIKARLYLEPDLFVQVYRNDQFDTTNLVLIHAGRRLYARDQLGGEWHCHPTHDPDLHDKSAEGSKAISLDEFLDKVEQIVTTLGLL